jgi:polysaccharide export outer membrane protein
MAYLLHANFAQTADVAYKLGSGDKIHVTVYNEQDLSGDYEVGDQGGLALPLIGQVLIGGKTTSEAEALIAAKYGANYLVNPRVSIQVLNYRPFFILGEVKNPGSYPYQSGMTIINAVALAGGYTPRANKSGIKIKHTNDPSAPEQSIDENGPVLPGDVVRVGERFF